MRLRHVKTSSSSLIPSPLNGGGGGGDTNGILKRDLPTRKIGGWDLETQVLTDAQEKEKYHKKKNVIFFVTSDFPLRWHKARSFSVGAQVILCEKKKTLCRLYHWKNETKTLLYICEKRRDIYKFSGASAKWFFLLSGAFSFCYPPPLPHIWSSHLILRRRVR